MLKSLTVGQVTGHRRQTVAGRGPTLPRCPSETLLAPSSTTLSRSPGRRSAGPPGRRSARQRSLTGTVQPPLARCTTSSREPSHFVHGSARSWVGERLVGAQGCCAGVRGWPGVALCAGFGCFGGRELAGGCTEWVVGWGLCMARPGLGWGNGWLVHKVAVLVFEVVQRSRFVQGLAVLAAVTRLTGAQSGLGAEVEGPR